VPGEVCVFLDGRGRLIELHAVPHRDRTEPTTADWHLPLLCAAGRGEVQPASDGQLPPVYADVRGSWDTSFLDRPDLPARVDAVACAGRAVYFHLGSAGLAIYGFVVSQGGRSLFSKEWFGD
jgi:hypothetical protein